MSHIVGSSVGQALNQDAVSMATMAADANECEGQVCLSIV